MPSRLSSPPSRGRTRRILVAVLLVGSTLLGTLGCRASTESADAADSAESSRAAAPAVVVSSERPPLAGTRLHAAVPGEPPGRLQGLGRGTVGVADGKVPDGVTVFDDHYPAVTRLDPALLSALREAATDAGGDGIEIHVNSGWRSRTLQEELFRQAVAQYGSTEEAERWVARPGTSAHESGHAVDLGGEDATRWLSRHGAGYGLCQVYGDEPWHFELRPAAVDHGCPEMYADPSHDPRLQR